MDFSEVKKFLNDSDRRWSVMKDKIKADRAFMAGTQYSDNDLKIIGRYRINDTLNVVANTVNSIVNNYTRFPFAWDTGDEQVNAALKTFLDTNGNGNAGRDALKNSVALGLGCVVVSNDVNPFTGNVEPVMYSVQQIENVYFDPSMKTIFNAQKSAIVEVMSKAEVANTYGEEFVIDENGGDNMAVKATVNAETEQAVVTYFVKNKGVVEVYTFTGGKLADTNVLKIGVIPVIPVFGEETWEDDKMQWQGIVRKTKSIQKTINLCAMQTNERLAISPKNVFMATREQIEGVENYWKDSGRNLNPLLIYNGRDRKGERLNPPDRVDTTVRFDDLGGIMNNILGLMSSVTGVAATGLMAGDKTATASVIEREAYQNCVSHFYDNLKDAYHLAGVIICQMIGVNVAYVNVTQGVDELYQNVEARNVISGIIDKMPEKQNELLMAILHTYTDNSVIRNLADNLTSGKTPREIELEKAIELGRKAIEEKDAQIAQIQKEMDDYNKGLALQKMKLDQDLILHREDNLLKIQLADAANKNGIEKQYIADSNKRELQLQRERAEAERASAENSPVIVETIAQEEI